MFKMFNLNNSNMLNIRTYHNATNAAPTTIRHIASVSTAISPLVKYSFSTFGQKRVRSTMNINTNTY